MKNKTRKVKKAAIRDGKCVSHHACSVKTIVCERAAGYNSAESPLAWLYNRRDKDGNSLVNEEEFQVGEQIKLDFTRAGLSNKLKSNWPTNIRVYGVNINHDISDTAVEIRRRIDNALKVVGLELSGVLVDVCCFLKGLGQLEMERNWPARSAKVVLKLALGRLATYYRGSTKTNRAGPIIHCGSADYRSALN